MTSCTNTKRKASFEPTFQEDVPSDIEEEQEEGFSSFKRIKLNEPIYISSDLKDDSVSYNNRNYLNDDEDEEDEDEDMPKFQYESKFKKSVSANNSTTFSDLVLFNKFIDFNCSVHDDDDESYDHISHAAELPQQAQQQIHIIDEKSVDVDIPLITSPDLLLPKASSSETSSIATLPSTSTSNHRWPLSQQDHSTSFSILTNPKKKQVRPVLSKAVTTVVDNLFVSQQEQSLEDYLLYDDDDDTTTTTTSTEEDSEEFSESDSIEPLIWTDKKIPLCCYRDRNKIPSDLMALSRVKNNKKSAINKRSLKSGKAREMIGGLSEW